MFKVFKVAIALSIFVTLLLTSLITRADEIKCEEGEIESWTAIGGFVFKVKGEPIQVQAINWDDFGSSKLCWQAINKFSRSDEFIGEGGTDNKVPTLQWNFDGDCSLKRCTKPQ